MSQSERRNTPRRPINLDVVVRRSSGTSVDEASWAGRTLDLSLGGCFLLMAKECAQGDRLRLALQVTGEAPAESSTQELEAEVMHTISRPVPVPRFRFAAGLRFVDPPPEVESMLRPLLSQAEEG